MSEKKTPKINLENVLKFENVKSALIADSDASFSKKIFLLKEFLTRDKDSIEKKYYDEFDSFFGDEELNFLKRVESFLKNRLGGRLGEKIKIQPLEEEPQFSFNAFKNDNFAYDVYFSCIDSKKKISSWQEAFISNEPLFPSWSEIYVKERAKLISIFTKMKDVKIFSIEFMGGVFVEVNFHFEEHGDYLNQLNEKIRFMKRYYEDNAVSEIIEENFLRFNA